MDLGQALLQEHANRDFAVYIKAPSGVTCVMVHKCVLVARSDFMANHLTGIYSDWYVWEVRSDQVLGATWVLRYLYTSDLSEVTDSEYESFRHLGLSIGLDIPHRHAAPAKEDAPESPPTRRYLPRRCKRKRVWI